MKKGLVAITVLSLLIMSTNISAQAVSLEKDKGTISVNTSSYTEIVPDMAEISFAIITSDTKSMQKATMLNKEISQKVYNDLEAMISAEKGDNIKTSDFSATPIYSYSNSKKNFERYEVSNRVVLKTKSIDKVGTIIDKAIKAGATNVENLSLSVSDYDAQCNDLISNATKKALTRANAIAGALSTSIIGLNNISTSCSANNYNQPRLYTAKNMISDVTAESLSTSGAVISKGVVKINANVNASFFVK